MPIQGDRGDLQTIREEILNNKTSIREVVLDYIENYQQLKFAEGLLKYTNNVEDRDVIVVWRYGPTGSGKTKQSMAEARSTYPENFWISGRDLKFWNGYWGQECVIIDDFRKDFCTFHELLRILDRYPYEVNVKCASIQLKATTIYITCPYHPAELYNNKRDEDVEQLLRRITRIEKFPTQIFDTEVGEVILDSPPTPIDDEMDEYYESEWDDLYEEYERNL